MPQVNEAKEYFREDEDEVMWDENGFVMRVRQQRRDQFMLRVHGNLDLTPNQCFRVFTNPDNSKVFRDVESIIYRKVLSAENGIKVVEVKQRARWRILIFQGAMVSHLVVTENPKKGVIQFRLAQPGLMKKWEGEWNLFHNAKNGTEVTLELVVSPSFVPPFLNGLLRSLTSGSTKRFIEDIQRVDRLYQQGGHTLNEILQYDGTTEEWCDYPSDSTDSFQDLQSFKIDFGDELVDGEFIEVDEIKKKKKFLWFGRSCKSQDDESQKQQKNITKNEKKRLKNQKKEEKQLRSVERNKLASERKKNKLEKKMSRRAEKRGRRKSKVEIETQVA